MICPGLHGVPFGLDLNPGEGTGHMVGSQHMQESHVWAAWLQVVLSHGVMSDSTL